MKKKSAENDQFPLNLEKMSRKSTNKKFWPKVRKKICLVHVPD